MLRILQNPPGNSQTSSKWWTSREGIGKTAYDYEENTEDEGMDGIYRPAITTVFQQNHEYLHPDGSWKNYTYHFNTSQEIETLLQQQGIEYEVKPWIKCPKCGRVMLDDGCANYRCENKSKQV